MGIFLLSLAGILAVIYGVWFSPVGPSWPKSIVKTGSILALAAVAVLSGGPVALVAGLVLGAIGDFWLSRDGEAAFLIGLVSFALGHLAYIVLLWQFGAAVGASVLSGIMAIYVIGMAMFLWPRTGDLRWPVMGYIAIIAAMGVLAIGLPAPWGLGVLAALVFVASDTILAWEVFVIPEEAAVRRITSRLVWVTYFAAQLLFLLCFAGQMLL